MNSAFLTNLIISRTGAVAHLEDFADRLSHLFSSGFILLLAGITTANVYFLRPIACTLPTAPEHRFVEFAESMCWVTGTIGLAESDAIPSSTEEWERMRERAGISFYQWVPFCLFAQALLFFIPHLFWQTMASFTMGENLEAILLKASNAVQAEDNQKRMKIVQAAAHQLFRLARQHRHVRSSRWSQWQHRFARTPWGTACLGFGKRTGHQIMLAYLLVKLLYLANAVGQLFLIRTFLGYTGDLIEFGNQLVRTLYAKREWNETDFFPRKTYCPVTVSHLGARSQTYLAICALPVNMFNEKIYIFLWMWIALVVVATACSLIVWLVRASLNGCQQRFTRDFLLLSIDSQLNEPERQHAPDCSGCRVGEDDERVEWFVNNMVRTDGAFILRMIRSNTGDVIAGEILNEWWHRFVEWESKNVATESKVNGVVGTIGFEQIKDKLSTML